MKRTLGIIGATAIAGIGVFAFVGTAQATTDPTNPCNVQGWYVNPDETEDAPTRTVDGFVFDNKDLIHHATNPLALADVHGGTFEATVSGKVVFKMETDNPYSTIIQNADGKFWSSRIAVNALGGQNNPVATVTDMIGSETKTGNPKYTNDTHVVTFGVGYWDVPGSTVVKSISFHGTKYNLTCKVEPTKTATATPTATNTATTNPTPTHTLPPKKCEAYVYYGSKVTICDRFANWTDKLACPQVAYKVKLVNVNNDPWGLDLNGRGTAGVGCEAFPVRKFPTNTISAPTHTTSTSPVASGSKLPVTGPKAGTLGIIGGVILAGGVAALILGRKRRNKVEFQA